MSMPQRYEDPGEPMYRRPEGEVWKVLDREAGATLLLKRIDGSLLQDKAVLHRLVKDVREAARLDHSAVARPLDVEVKGGQCWLTQQLPPGMPLTRILADPGLTDLSSEDLARRVLEVGGEVLAQAMQRAPHGTLGPESVWVTPEGDIVFTDFGVGGLGLVRDRYAAPECQRPGAAPTHASEQYALGALAHQVLTGEAPGARPLPVRSAARIDRGLARVVDRTLMASPAERFSSLSEMGAGVRRKPRLRPLTAGAITVLLLAAVAGAFALLAPERMPWAGGDTATATETREDGLDPHVAMRLRRVHDRARELDMSGLADELARATQALRRGETLGVPGAGGIEDMVDEAAREASGAVVDRMRRLAAEAEGRRDLEESQALEIDDTTADLERLLSWASPGEVDGLQRELARLERWRARVGDLRSRLATEVFGSPAWRRAMTSLLDARRMHDQKRYDGVLELARGSLPLFEEIRDRLLGIPPSTEPEPEPPPEPPSPELPGLQDPPVVVKIPRDDLRRGMEPPDPGTEDPDPEAPPPFAFDDHADVMEALRRYVDAMDAEIEIHGDGTWTMLLVAGDDRLRMAGTWRRTDEGVELKVLLVNRQRAVRRTVVVIRIVHGRPQGVHLLFRRVPDVLSWILGSLQKRLDGGPLLGWLPPSYVPVGPSFTLPIIDLASPHAGTASKTGRFEARGIVGAPGAPRMSLHGGHVPLQGNAFRGVAQAGGGGRVMLESAYVAARHFGSARIREVIVDRTLPQVGLLSPAAGERLYPGSTVAVVGHAFDANLTGVTVNGKPAVLSKTGGLETFSLSLPVPSEGSFAIVVEATDKAGNVRTVQRRTERESKNVLPIRLRTPRQGELVAYRRVEVQGWIPEQAPGAALRVNGQHATVEENGSFASWVEAPSDGRFEITSTYGGPDVVEQSVQVFVEVDTEPPLLVLREPASGLVTDKDYVIVKGRVTDVHPEAVLVADRDHRLRGDGTFSVRVGLQAGTNEIEVMARDAAGGTSEIQGVTVVYEPPPEEVGAPRILRPRFGDVVGLGPVTVVGRVAKAVEGSYVTINDQRVDLEGTSFEGSVKADAEGSLTIKVRHEGESVVPREKSVTITVDANPPTVEIQDPSPQTTEVFSTRLRVRGRVSDLSVERLRIEVNGRRSRLSFDRRTGRFQTTVTLPIDVATTIRVVAVDKVGYEGADERTVTARVAQPPISRPPANPPPGTQPLPPGRTAPQYDVLIEGVAYFWREENSLLDLDDVRRRQPATPQWQPMTGRVVRMLMQGVSPNAFHVKVVIRGVFQTNVIGAILGVRGRRLRQGPGPFQHELEFHYPAPERRVESGRPVFSKTSERVGFLVQDAGRVVQQITKNVRILPTPGGVIIRR